jgi:pimeloyl-ACP methyl ester carboxylesterase
MKNLRKYGAPPRNIAVIHGGPGAPGEMAPVARELASIRGVLEPLQTAPTIEGQIRELRDILETNGDFPQIVIGWSWGAWLSFVFASRYSSLVERIILIGSGPFEERYARNIMQTRLSRMNEKETSEVLLLIKILDDPTLSNKNEAMKRFGKIISKADSYDPIPHKSELLKCQYDIYHNVWEQAALMRSSGRLLRFGRKIKCPVVAIHGDYDPHPYQGVKNSLSRVLKDFRFILLEKCGHQPWIEKYAKDKFFNILRNEIGA